MFAYHPKNWLYAPCCKNGFVDNFCMQKYALNAGYYLRCLWCKSVEFRKAVKLQGIFVPDREASCETEPNAYQDLCLRHARCDVENCNCPRGRDYIQKPKWSLILYDLCGSFGAHNPTCIPGFENSKKKVNKFACETCLQKEYIEEEVHNLGKTEDCGVSPKIFCERLDFPESISSTALASTSSNQLLDSIDNEIIERNLNEFSTDEDFVKLEMYEFSKGLSCLDKVAVKLRTSDSRFARKTMEDIKRSSNLITAEDISERLGDLSILNQIDEIIDQNLQ